MKSGKRKAPSTRSNYTRTVRETPKAVKDVAAYRPVEAPERNRRALGVLFAARHLLIQGWCARNLSVDANGRSSWQSDLPPVAWSLAGAIAEGGEGGIEAEWARQFIRKLIVSSISDWETHPLRTKEQVVELVGQAISLAGGNAPKRGGWSVTVYGGAR